MSTPNSSPAADNAGAGGLPPPPHPLREFWGYFSQNRGAIIGLVYVVFMVFMAVFADLIAPHSAIEQYRDATLLPPDRKSVV